MSLVLKGIHKQFKRRDVLNGVDLTIQSKEIHALVGVSGSGKSTLLRIIAGLESADSGALTWDGETLLGTPPHKRQITMLSQSPLLFPHLSVGENVTLATKTRSREQAEAWLARVRLPGRYDDAIHELSGGEQQRVSFARALAATPRLILLDEPFTNLDPDLKYELQRLIRDLVQQLELTALLVTHDREEAMLIAERVTLLEDGAVLATGTPEELYESEPAFGDFISFEGTAYPATAIEVTVEGAEPAVLVRKLERFGHRLGEYRLSTGTYAILPRDESFQVGETYYLRKKKGVVKC